MKECEKYAALLDAFSEGDLFMEDMVQVQTHLMNCPDCQAYLEDLLAIRAAFPTVEETEVPEGFADRVMAAVAEHPRTAAPAAPAKQKKAPWGRVLVSLAACCAIVILLKTPILGGSSAEKSAVYTAETTAEKPKATMEPQEAAPAAEEAAEDAASSVADGTLTQDTVVEMELTVNDSYSYTTNAESKVVEFGGEESVEVVVTPAEGAPEAAPELILTAEEAGDLLDGFTPAEVLETELHYELSAQEYIGLLTALPREIRQSAPASTTETMTVVVLK